MGVKTRSPLRTLTYQKICLQSYLSISNNKTTIMKRAITTLLMILIANPQFIDASPMPTPNIVECDLDPTLECCEKESTRYTKYCVNYSACSNHPWNAHKTRGS